MKISYNWKLAIYSYVIQVGVLFGASLSDPSLPDADLERVFLRPITDPESLLTGLLDLGEDGLPEAPDFTEDGEGFLERLRLAERSDAGDLSLLDRTDRGLAECFDVGDRGVRDREDLALPEWADLEPPDLTESALFERSDFGLPEWDDFGLPECTDLGLPEQTDFGLPDALLFGLTDFDDMRRFANFVRKLSELDKLGDLLDLALPECSDNERLRCEPTALGLCDFGDGEVDREWDDLELADMCEPASEPVGLTERFGEWADLDEALECGEPDTPEATEVVDWVRLRPAETEWAEAGDAEWGGSGLSTEVCTRVRPGEIADRAEPPSSSLTDFTDPADGDRFPTEDLLADEADLSDRAAGEPAGDLDPDKFLLDFFDDSSPESDCLLDDEALLSESDPESKK